MNNMIDNDEQDCRIVFFGYSECMCPFTSKVIQLANTHKLKYKHYELLTQEDARVLRANNDYKGTFPIVFYRTSLDIELAYIGGANDLEHKLQL
jgi:glutaredoxin-related protein